jgi:hypothetical protein
MRGMATHSLTPLLRSAGIANLVVSKSENYRSNARLCEHISSQGLAICRRGRFFIPRSIQAAGKDVTAVLSIWVRCGAEPSACCLSVPT